MANPNPSPATRFQPGNPGGGKTAEQKKLEYEAAEMSARIRHKMLSVISEKLNDMPDTEWSIITDTLSSEVLRLLKDSEDRAHGTPKQAVEMSGPEGGPIQTEEVIRDADAFARRMAGFAARANAGGVGTPDAGSESGA